MKKSMKEGVPKFYFSKKYYCERECVLCGNPNNMCSKCREFYYYFMVDNEENESKKN